LGINRQWSGEVVERFRGLNRNVGVDTRTNSTSLTETVAVRGQRWFRPLPRRDDV